VWPITLVFIIIAMAGIYSLPSQRRVENTVMQQKATAIAEEMTVYRDAVRRYYSANPAAAAVTLQTLIATGSLPSWSLLSQRGVTIFANHYSGNQIYIYANRLPEVDINAQLAAVSKRSILVGTYRASDQMLYSKVTGQTGISLAALAPYNLPDGVPVWLAKPD